MGQQSLIYSFVARGTVILSEYTEFTGNFTTIASQCLQKLPTDNNKFTYNCDGHTFNYLLEDGFTYCVVAVEAAGRNLPIAFLVRIKEEFTKKYGGGKAATAVANSLNKEFGSKLKEQMQYCVDHPEEISNHEKVKAQVSDVKGVMMENIEKILDRGEKIEIPVDKTDNVEGTLQSHLENQQYQFEKNYAVQLIFGVDDLHSSNYIHGDIHPQNLFVVSNENSNEKQIKIGELGKCRNSTHFSELTALNYMAPEVMKGLPDPSKEMDIWALGCTLYRMLTGRDLFRLGIDADDQLEKYLFVINQMKEIYSKTAEHANFYGWIRATPGLDGLDEDVLDLLGKMIAVKPEWRITARNAAEHKYCTGVRGGTEQGCSS